MGKSTDAAALLRDAGAEPLGCDSRWLELPGGRMHYLDEGPSGGGEGAVLFVHGNPTWSYHWRRLIQRLRGARRCVAMDHLGMGLSDMPPRPLRLADHVENLTRLVDALELSRVTLVAQDWGGAIGLGAALERTDRFESIVLFNTGAFPPPFIPRRIDVCRTPLLGRLALQGFNGFSRAALHMTLTRRRLPRAVAAGCLAPYSSWARRRGVYDFVADIPRKPAHPTWSTLETIERRLPELAHLPVCLIWGMRDWCFTPACLDRFLAAWPHAEAHRLHDVGHWVLEDAPDEAAAILERFLTDSRTAAPTADAR